MRNPKFSNNQTFSLAAKPPFYFEGMTTRVFPLRASLFQQQRFADAYFNQVIPKEIGRFQAFMPYVLLMIMDYGKMAATATNMGWVSQREIMFSVPLLWYRVIDGQWVFKDWATATPFIYVDDELSMTLGRTAYGWPKTLAWLAPGLNEWIEDPRAAPRAAGVSTMVFPEVYAGQRQQPRVFLEVRESASLSPLDFPQDATGPFMPWTMLSNMAKSSAGLIGDGVQLLDGLGVTRKRPGASGGNYRRMLDRARELGDLYTMDMAFNTVNLKQFRRADQPSEFCYQALTNAQMKLTAFNRGGMIGDLHLLAGDASGGYAIDLHRWSSLPIIETLGLEVEKEWQGDGSMVSRLRPVMPFWYDVNMDYDVGVTECWRTPHADWRDRRGRPLRAKQGPPKDASFNTALGASGQAVAGPFRFPSTTIRVLPLLAYHAKLQQFLDGYLNTPLESTDLRFTVWGSPKEEMAEDHFAYVYLVAINYEEMSSATNNIGWWAERELFFCVPVKVEQKNAKGEWELKTLGLVPTFSYANSTTAAIARSEVIGVATTKAAIESPPDVWMADRGPARDKLRTLLTMSSEVLPALGEGQKTQTQVILDILEGDVLPSMDDHRWRAIGEDWGTLLKRELERKKTTSHDRPSENSDARALSLELLANRLPLNFFTMKQYRDISDPGNACYQSVVEIERTIEDVLDLREIESPCHVRIHSYPSQPFVEALGLVVKLTREDGGSVVHCLQPVRPFWMKASLTEELGRAVTTRAGTESWSETVLKEPYFAGPPPVAKQGADFRTWPRVGRGLVEQIKSEEPVRLRSRTRRWFEDAWPLAKLQAQSEAFVAQAGAHAEQEGVSLEVPPIPDEYALLTLDAAKRAVGKIDPQIVIETILSREWENWNPRARWRRSRTEMLRRLDQLLTGASSTELAKREIDFFRKTLADIRQESPRPQIGKDFKLNLDILEKIGAGRQALEQGFSDLGKVTSTAGFYDAVTAFVAGARAFLRTLDPSFDVPIDPIAPLGRSVVSFVRPIANKLKLVELPDPELRKKGRLSNTWLTQIEAAWVAFKNGDESSQLRQLVQEVRQLHDLRREHVIDRLAKAAQKPPFCVPRLCVGPEAERVFPRDDTWEDHWYIGYVAEGDSSHYDYDHDDSPTSLGKSPRGAASKSGAQPGKLAASEAVADHLQAPLTSARFGFTTTGPSLGGSTPDDAPAATPTSTDSEIATPPSAPDPNKPTPAR